MFRKLLPHILLDFSLVFLVLWVIDRINGAMNMLGRDAFKLPFAVFLILVLIESVLLIIQQRRE